MKTGKKGLLFSVLRTEASKMMCPIEKPVKVEWMDGLWVGRWIDSG